MMMKKKFSKMISVLLIISLLLSYFGPFIPTAKASSTYQVSVLKSDGSSESLGTYGSYSEASYKMKSHNSNASSVAVVYKDGTIINANYAIARLHVGDVISLFPSASSDSRYTSVHTSYGKDAAFLDYDENSGRAKIRISGYTGWTYLSNLDIVPLSQMGKSSVKILADIALRVRREPTTESDNEMGFVHQGQVYTYYEKRSNEGYTWYKINFNGEYGWIASLNSNWTTEIEGSNLQTFYEPYTKSGNLIHYYDSEWGQYYTNLGPKPSFLNNGVTYYSFDGNYFYQSLTSMLDDYKANTHSKAVNSEPYYAYYLYLPNHSKTNYEAEDFDRIIEGYGYYRGKEAGVNYVTSDGAWVSGLNRDGMSVLYKQGSAFIEAQERYGVSALLSFSAALNESAYGTSVIAFAKNNVFGHAAYDSCPFTCATTYATVRDSVMEHARLTGTDYNHPNSSLYYGGHYGNKGSGMNVNYATDPYWGEKAAANYYMTDLDFGKQDYMSSTIGVKTSSGNVKVYQSASTSSKVLYTLNNQYVDVSNMPVSVIGKVENNGTSFYKIKTDIGIDANGNITTDSYDSNLSVGYVEANNLYVSNKQPSITASDIKVSMGQTPNYLSGVSASDPEDGDLTSKVKVIQNNVKVNTPGTYSVTYFVEDYSHFGVEKKVTVTVIGSTDPKIEAQNQTVSQFTTFDYKKNVKATDYDGKDLTNFIQTSGTVDTNKLGNYDVTYSVTNSLGKSASKTIQVTVKENAKPVIQASNQTIKINTTFDPLKGVSASDAEDGDLTSKIVVTNNTVDSSKSGTYEVTYEVEDAAKQKTTKTVQVSVSDKEEVKGSFYFDYLNKLDGKLKLRGYLTLSGMNNTLNEEIQYKIIYQNVDTSDTIIKDITRIEDLSGITRPIYSEDGFKYTHSWFDAEIDIDSLPSGNYIMYIQAEGPSTFSKALVNNVLYKTEVTSYEGTEKVVNIKNNYSDRSSAVTLYVRENQEFLKTVGSYYNQYDTWRTLEFSNNKLHIKGVSYSYGMDLSEGQSVTRKIIFENQETHETTSYDLGSITNGLYKVALPVSDGYDKTRAWYDANIDLSSLSKGNYVIYIATKSNVVDMNEFTDIMGRDLSSKKLTINGKTYSFYLNLSKGNRIELKVA